MYTKVFRQIYDGTLADNWQALVTFQQLLILADENGVVDMTLGAVHRITGIPIDILQAGITVLESTDQGSRTPDMEGRRIARLDPHREWGWFLVNFRKYRDMVSKEEKKEADRRRMADKRAAEKTNGISSVVNSRGESPTVADVAHADAYTEADKARARSRAPDANAPALPADPKPKAKRRRKSEGITFGEFVALCRETGEKAIPEGHAVFRFASDAGIPLDFIRLMWREFRRRHSTGKRAQNRQASLDGWRQTFDNAVRGAWYDLWKFNRDGECYLTPAGEALANEANAEAKRTDQGAGVQA